MVPSESDFPRDKAFWTVRRQEIDYDGQIAEFEHGLRSLRKTALGVVVVVGLLAIVLALTGRTTSASGLFLSVIAPLATVLVIIEIVALVRGRRR